MNLRTSLPGGQQCACAGQIKLTKAAQQNLTDKGLLTDPQEFFQAYVEGRTDRGLIGDSLWKWLADSYPEIRGFIVRDRDEHEAILEQEYLRVAKQSKIRRMEPQKPDAPREYTAEIRQWAEVLVGDPAFFYKLGKALEEGFILPDVGSPRYILGEEDLKRQLAVNLAMARLGRHSINLIYGAFAAGKDTLVKMLLRLIGTRYERRGYLTAAGFRYSQGLRDAEILYLPEADLSGEKGRQMRFMRADDGGFEVEYAHMDKDTGIMVTEIEQVGRRTIVITTNSETFDGALASGGWLFQTDDSAELTARVVPAKLQDFVKPREILTDDAVLAWQCAFDILTKPDDVPPFIAIPFAPALITLLNTRRSEARRSPEKLCELIQSIAILRRFQKPEEKRGEADIIDLFIALRIGRAAISETMGELTSKERAVFEAVKEIEIDTAIELLDPETEDRAKISDGTTAKDIAIKLPYPTDTCYRQAESLAKKGYLIKSKRGRENAYFTKDGADSGDLGVSRIPTLDSPESVLKLCEELVYVKSDLGNSDKGGVDVIDPITGRLLSLGDISESDETKQSSETPSKSQNNISFVGIRVPPTSEIAEVQVDKEKGLSESEEIKNVKLEMGERVNSEKGFKHPGIRVPPTPEHLGSSSAELRTIILSYIRKIVDLDPTGANLDVLAIRIPKDYPKYRTGKVLGAIEALLKDGMLTKEMTKYGPYLKLVPDDSLTSMPRESAEDGEVVA